MLKKRKPFKICFNDVNLYKDHKKLLSPFNFNFNYYETSDFTLNFFDKKYAPKEKKFVYAIEY
jgi:hypothetical protein